CPAPATRPTCYDVTGISGVVVQRCALQGAPLDRPATVRAGVDESQMGQAHGGARTAGPRTSGRKAVQHWSTFVGDLVVAGHASRQGKRPETAPHLRAENRKLRGAGRADRPGLDSEAAVVSCGAAGSGTVPPSPPSSTSRPG